MSIKNSSIEELLDAAEQIYLYKDEITSPDPMLALGLVLKAIEQRKEELSEVPSEKLEILTEILKSLSMHKEISKIFSDTVDAALEQSKHQMIHTPDEMYLNPMKIKI